MVVEFVDARTLEIGTALYSKSTRYLIRRARWFRPSNLRLRGFQAIQEDSLLFP
jgi:hypothetical protein